MSRSRSFIPIVILIFSQIFLFSNALGASSPATDISQPFQVTEFVKESNGFSLSLDFAKPSWEIVESGDRRLWSAQFENGGMISEESMPNVPSAGRLFRIPPGSGVTVEITNVEYETLTDIDIASYLGGDENSGFPTLPDSKDEWYPRKWAEISEPAIIHDFRVSSLMTYPVQVNPYRREVRIASNIQASIRFDGADDRNTIPHHPTRISSAFLPWYRQLLDWDESELDEYELYRGRVQVVLQDDNTLLNLMEPWFEWKLQRGWELELLTDSDVNWNAGSIKSELQDRYDDEPFDYIVVIGDMSGPFAVPPGRGQGDHEYAKLAGNDRLADVMIGRISVESTQQLMIYINKMLYYEKDLSEVDTDWLNRGAVSTSMTGLTSTRFTGRYICQLMEEYGYTQVDTAWWGNWSTTMREALEDGVGYFSHRGISNLQGVNNDYMTPLVLEITCSPGNWVNTTGRTEQWMRAGFVNTPKGSIGTISTATAGTHTKYNNIMIGGGGISAFIYGVLTTGQVQYGAKKALFDNFTPFDNGGVANFSQWLNLMGDPTVWLWTTEPMELTVDASETFELGTNSYEVLVENEDEDPVEGAWVTLYKMDDNDEIIARGETDSDGYAVLYAPIESTGEAVLTVSSQHFMPVQIDVDVVSPEDRIGYESITFQDDGNDGTDGNDNRIPEAGETVGLIITAVNTGESNQANVQVTGESDDDWIEDVSGTVDFGTINSGNSSEGDGLILVEIASEAQHDWITHINLEFGSDEHTYDDMTQIKINAPQLTLVEIDIDGDLDPGETVDFTVELMNVGGSDAAASTGILTSLDENVTVFDNEADFDAISVDESETSGDYRISASSYAFPGQIARTLLVVTSETGQVDSVYINLAIGDREESDPSGPDSYGYFAYDQTDTDYELAPEFDWVEICQEEDDYDFEGELLDIDDTGQNVDQALVIDLPFTFQFYGEEFDEVSVAVNGLIALGDQSMFLQSRNWTIPSPLGPNYMIAPYWDDRTNTGDTGVYWYYDEPENRIIIEWYEVGDANNGSRCTFEVIFYAQARGHYTYSGDNEFLFQYLDMTHSTGVYSDTPWFTTGIENGDQTDGLLLCYWNAEEPGAVEIEDECSILFSTNKTLIAGIVEGTVTREANGDPIGEVNVLLDNEHFSVYTDENGYFFLYGVLPQEYDDLTIRKIGFNEAVAPAFQVANEETTRVDITMTHPQIHFPEEDITETLYLDDETTIPFVVENTGNGIFDFTVEIDSIGPVEDSALAGGNRKGNNSSSELDDPWDEYFQFDLNPDPHETRNRGVIFDGEYFWVSGSNNFDPLAMNQLYKYDREGNFLEAFDQPVPEDDDSPVGFFGMAWDGTYLYGIDNGVMYQMDVTGDSIEVLETFDIPIDEIRFIAYDPENDLFYFGDDDSDIYKMDRDGTILRRYEQEFYPRGAGWNPADKDGYLLYFVTRWLGEDIMHIRKMNTETGDVVNVFQFESEHLPTGGDICLSWNPQHWAFMTVIDQGQNDMVQLWKISVNTDWLHISPSEGTIEAGEDITIDVDLDAATLGADTYSLWLKFTHSSVEQISWIPVVVNAIEEVGVTEELPLKWSFDGVWPNPFNPSMSVRFALKEPAFVKAKVYNLLGRQVAVMADAPMTAGRHTLMFNGSDLASGMYFIRFDAGPLHETRKAVLLK
ncbi:MAG: C25 family cysteine peptidase [Candidatus Electryonea clarkiae]|nr:C25 family cysteine peptidase [Candidatus Electryonea clarkiae]MDP8285471.1 C25 family cysteine peptidase [Candidatus Electryonea clarkiae]